MYRSRTQEISIYAENNYIPYVFKAILILSRGHLLLYTAQRHFPSEELATNAALTIIIYNI